MENPLKNLNVKKIELARLEKYIDFLFGIVFISLLAYLGLIFYSSFLPVYKFDASNAANGAPVGGNVKLQEKVLDKVIERLGNEEKAYNDTIDNKLYVKDPFVR